MYARNAHEPLDLKLIISLLLSFLLLFGINYKAAAQGWGFTFQLDQSGPCGANVPGIPSFTVPPAFPTQSQCESLRQFILAVKESMPVYDNRGKYIGDCSVFYSCTPCSGSDIVIQGQVAPGEVSFDGQYQGKPLFTTHESAAFEDWAKDYKQQLAAYGITSILGNTITPSGLPTTGDKEFDSFYSQQTANFNPTSRAVNLPKNLDANAVDLSGKTGVVSLLTSPEEQARRDKWYSDNIQDQGYSNLDQMKKNDPAIVDLPKSNETNATPGNQAVADNVIDGISDLLGTVVTTLVPEAVLPNFIQSFETNLASATPANIQKGLDVLKGTGSINDVKDPGQLVRSAYINTCTLCKWILTPAKY